MNGSDQSHNDWIISFHCVCSQSDKRDIGFLSGVMFMSDSDRGVSVKRDEKEVGG